MGLRESEAQEPLQRLADDAAGLIGVEVAAVYRIVSGERYARWACDSGVQDEHAHALIMALHLPIAPDVAEITKSAATNGSIQPIAALPIVGSGTLSRGILCLFDDPRRKLVPGETAILAVLAERAALAIENAELARSRDEVDASYRFLLDRLPDIMWAAGADRIFTYVSAGCERILGYRPEELIGRSSEIVMHESSREAFQAGYRWQIGHPDADQTYRVNLRHKDGHPVPVELHNIGTPINGRYGGGTGSVREISERLRLERELQEQAAELAASRERAHLAEELHDSVTQALFTMTLTAGSARMLLERNAPGVDVKLQELSSLAREALADMRSLIFELRPGSLAEEGLVPSLRKHLAAVQARSGLAIQFAPQPDLGRFPLPIEGALYRIAQEAVHNVVKHAQANEVRIALGAGSDGIHMDIRDDGVGFNPATHSGGLGLSTMSARAERLGGSVEVQSAPAGGTAITVVLPMTAGS